MLEHHRRRAAGLELELDARAYTDGGAAVAPALTTSTSRQRSAIVLVCARPESTVAAAFRWLGISTSSSHRAASAIGSVR